MISLVSFQAAWNLIASVPAVTLVTVDPSVVYTRWWIALATAVVVLVVVVVLLEAIRRTAGRILGVVSDIWTGGTHIAANTVTIAQLQRTNMQAGMLLERAGSIALAVERIRRVTAPPQSRGDNP